MSEDSQTIIPRSFVELFIPEGSFKPSETRDVIAARYDLCEDIAQMLIEHARDKLFELGATEQDVLERIRRGLLVDGSVVSHDEAGGVLRRLAEVLDWPALDAPGDT